MNLVWSPEAARQLRDIVEYIANDDPAAAEGVLVRIQDVASELCQFPYLGRPASVAGFRVFAIHRLPYLVVYRVRDDTVEIASVWHGRQNWKR